MKKIFFIIILLTPCAGITALWNPINGKVNCTICTIAYIKSASSGQYYHPVSDTSYAVKEFAPVTKTGYVQDNKTHIAVNTQVIKDEIKFIYPSTEESQYFMVVLIYDKPPHHAIVATYENGDVYLFDPQAGQIFEVPASKEKKVESLYVLEIDTTKLTDEFLSSVNIRRVCQ